MRELPEKYQARNGGQSKGEMRNEEESDGKTKVLVFLKFAVFSARTLSGFV